MANANKLLVEDHLTCQICLIKFDEAENKPLTLISCGHTYCHCCVDKFKDKRCPLDRQLFTSTVINWLAIGMVAARLPADTEHTFSKIIKPSKMDQEHNKNGLTRSMAATSQTIALCSISECRNPVAAATDGQVAKYCNSCQTRIDSLHTNKIIRMPGSTIRDDVPRRTCVAARCTNLRMSTNEGDRFRDLCRDCFKRMYVDPDRVDLDPYRFQPRPKVVDNGETRNPDIMSPRFYQANAIEMLATRHLDRDASYKTPTRHLTSALCSISECRNLTATTTNGQAAKYCDSCQKLIDLLHTNKMNRMQDNLRNNTRPIEQQNNLSSKYPDAKPSLPVQYATPPLTYNIPVHHEPPRTYDATLTSNSLLYSTQLLHTKPTYGTPPEAISTNYNNARTMQTRIRPKPCRSCGREFSFGSHDIVQMCTHCRHRL